MGAAAAGGCCSRQKTNIHFHSGRTKATTPRMHCGRPHLVQAFRQQPDQRRAGGQQCDVLGMEQLLAQRLALGAAIKRVAGAGSLLHHLLLLLLRPSSRWLVYLLLSLLHLLLLVMLLLGCAAGRSFAVAVFAAWRQRQPPEELVERLQLRRRREAGKQPCLKVMQVCSEAAVIQLCRLQAIEGRQAGMSACGRPRGAKLAIGCDSQGADSPQLTSLVDRGKAEAEENARACRCAQSCHAGGGGTCGMPRSTPSRP